MPEIKNDALYQMLREGRCQEFNAQVGAGTPVDLTNADLRNVDLQGTDLCRANLRGAYLRGADLRGCDLSQADLEGASIHGAKIAGTLFPRDLSAHEIRMSYELGTRMRTGR